MPVKVFLIEEHPQVRQALSKRLRNSAEVELVGEAGEAMQALRQVREARPEVVLIETKRGDGMGLEIIRQVAQEPWLPRVIVLTTYEEPWERTASHRAGAHDYLLKQIDVPELVKRIQRQSN